jgi:ABC-type polysaccharide/polyol phosphate transport system ATPase subunit
MVVVSGHGDALIINVCRHLLELQAGHVQDFETVETMLCNETCGIGVQNDCLLLAIGIR